MKHKAPQFDLPGMANAFNLAGQTLTQEPPKPPPHKPEEDPSLFADCLDDCTLVYPPQAPNPAGKVVEWAGVDPICQWCNQPAKLRLRAASGEVILAACRNHATEYRIATLNLLAPLSPHV